MEGVRNQWENAEAEVEEEVLLQRPARVSSNTSISTTNFGIEAIEHTNGSSALKDGGLKFFQSKIDSSDERMDVSAENLGLSLIAAINPQNEDDENNKILAASDLPPSEDSASLITVSNESGRVVMRNQDGQEVQELYLERVFQMAPTHGFYCPNCDACIQKVLIYNREWKETIAPPHPRPTDRFRCTSCFSFLIPIGSWFFPWWIRDEHTDTAPTVEGPPSQAVKVAPDIKAPAAIEPSKLAVDTPTDSGRQTLQLDQGITEEASTVDIKVEDKTRDSSNYLSEIITDESAQRAAGKKSSVADWAVIAKATVAFKPKQPETKIDSSAILVQQPELKQIVVDEPKLAGKVGVADTAPSEAEPAPSITVPTVDDRTTEIQEPGSSKAFEILKSIVYGGLVESIASLSVVTSSASADATTLNIIALALANLIGGLFVLGHNLWELHAEQPRKANNQTDATVDRYSELLGDKKNFILHASAATLSFLIFGLIPPVVYGFSFYNSDDKDYKLAAVAGASLLCIVLLSIAKTYIQRPNNYQTYFKTVFYYVSTAGLASVISYVAGDLIRKLIEKLGWFQSGSSTFALPLPEMNMDKNRSHWKML